MPVKVYTAFFLAATAFAQRHAPPAARIEVPLEGVSFPMQDMGGRPVVEVRINGKGPYRFILDTGANITVIGAALNRELGLRPAPGVNAIADGNGPSPAIVAVSELRLGGVVLGDLVAAVMPLDTVLLGDDAPSGVLSAAGFPGYLLTFDYPARSISLKKGELPPADSRSTFSYPEGQPLPLLPVRIAGRTTTVLMDTGSGSGLTLPYKFLEELPLASPAKDGGKVRLLRGEFPVATARVEGAIEIGRYRIDTREDVSFSDARAGAQDVIGDIGYDILRDFVVTLDAKNHRVRLFR